MKLNKKIKYFFRKIRSVIPFEKQNSTIAVKPLEELNRIPLVFESSEKPKVSIIIPFYNEEIYTWNCLNFLNKYLTNEIPYEILLIDDNSPEKNDFSLIKGISIHRNTVNLGFLKNINKGIQLAKGEYIYILNNDTEVQENFLKELFFVFENFENVGAVGSMLLNPNDTLQEAGSVFLKDFNIRQIVKNKKPYYSEINYIYKVDYCSGCSLLFKKHKDDGVTLNLFDEIFAPAYFEETDFCFDLKYNQNKDVYYTPFSKVMHYNGISYNNKKKSSVESTKQKENLFNTNKEKFKNKWKLQIEAIKATTIEERIIEKYNNKSIAFVINDIPQEESKLNRLKEIIKDFINNNYHVSLIFTNTNNNNSCTNFYRRMGVNVFQSEYPSKNKYVEYTAKNNLNVNLIWFYGPDTFKENYFKFEKVFKNAKYIYDMAGIHHLKALNKVNIDSEILNKSNYKKYKEIETVFVKNADYVITLSDHEKDYMKSFFNNDHLILISDVNHSKIKTENSIHFSSYFN